MNKTETINLFKLLFKQLSITNPCLQRAILANIEKESNFKPVEENLNYAHTDNERIRRIFTLRVKSLSDDELSEIKQDKVRFAELIYGCHTRIGMTMGNTEEGDGWKYRGRGFIQLTGKNNYEYYGKMAGVDIVTNPDLLITDIDVSAKVTIAFILDNLKRYDNLDTMNQDEANRRVTKVVGGYWLNLDVGIGAELLKKVTTLANTYGI